LLLLPFAKLCGVAYEGPQYFRGGFEAGPWPLPDDSNGSDADSETAGLDVGAWTLLNDSKGSTADVGAIWLWYHGRTGTYAAVFRGTADWYDVGVCICLAQAWPRPPTASAAPDSSASPGRQSLSLYICFSQLHCCGALNGARQARPCRRPRRRSVQPGLAMTVGKRCNNF
jgi:hypothetical protein